MERRVKRVFLATLTMAMTTVPGAGKMDAFAAACRTVVVTASTAAADADAEASASAEADADASATESDSNEPKVLIQAIETNDAKSKREVGWLGVSTQETSDALGSQLGLSSGEGLTVIYVAHDSPAAKAGLKKSDVLVEFDGQLLVHPAQFRKLIQMHKEGDTVNLTIYRGGKKQSLSATIGKTRRNLGFYQDERSFPGDMRVITRELNDLPTGENIREQLKTLRESLAKTSLDKENLSMEIRRSVEEVRKNLQEALREATNASRTFGPAAREFQELARRGMDVEKDATVVVKSKRHNVQSIVKTDDTGTYVIVATPKKQLTAHDKSGKLLFDGEIETDEEQARVPKDVWEKVKPMLDQLKDDKASAPELDEENVGILELKLGKI